MYKEKIKFPFRCPVCGKSEFVDVDYLLEEDKDIEVYTIDPVTGEKKMMLFLHMEYIVNFVDGLMI